MKKPTVTFKDTAGVEDALGGGCRYVLLHIEGHPVLGSEPMITTSLVERITYDENRNPVRIETLNTIYERRL